MTTEPSLVSTKLSWYSPNWSKKDNFLGTARCIWICYNTVEGST